MMTQYKCINQMKGKQMKNNINLANFLHVSSNNYQFHTNEKKFLKKEKRNEVT